MEWAMGVGRWSRSENYTIECLSLYKQSIESTAFKIQLSMKPLSSISLMKGEKIRTRACVQWVEGFFQGGTNAG